MKRRSMISLAGLKNMSAVGKSSINPCLSSPSITLRLDCKPSAKNRVPFLSSISETFLGYPPPYSHLLQHTPFPLLRCSSLANQRPRLGTTDETTKAVYVRTFMQHKTLFRFHIKSAWVLHRSSCFGYSNCVSAVLLKLVSIALFLKL